MRASRSVALTLVHRFVLFVWKPPSCSENALYMAETAQEDTSAILGAVSCQKCTILNRKSSGTWHQVWGRGLVRIQNYQCAVSTRMIFVLNTPQGSFDNGEVVSMKFNTGPNGERQQK